MQHLINLFNIHIFFVMTCCRFPHAVYHLQELSQSDCLHICRLENVCDLTK